MKDFKCPHCGKLLFRGKLANIEIKCKCGKLVKVNYISSTGLLDLNLKKLIYVESKKEGGKC